MTKPNSTLAHHNVDAHGALNAALQVTDGKVPETLPDAVSETPTYSLSADAFILRLPNGLKFYYRRGAAVVCCKPANVPQGDVELFLNGTVRGAVCYLNGMVALHASAVVHNGHVFAFSAQTAGGKSTLLAGLINRGFTPFADDVLPVMLDDAGQVIAHAGPAKMKLWSDALDLNGLHPGERVRDGIEKFYVPTRSWQLGPAPLRRLFMLSERSVGPPELIPESGTGRLAALNASLYRPTLCAVAMGNHDYFRTANAISQSIGVTRFARPMRKADFAAGIDLIAEAIRQDNDPS